MAQEVLKEIGLYQDKDMIDQDALKDINFFMGDMNFRIKKTFSEFAPYVEEAPIYVEQLDQLYELMKYGGKFPGYKESKITFWPTYKRTKESNVFINKNEQCPSYTDRILFKNNSNCEFTIYNYNAHEEYFGSDHRPVYLHMGL